jgi:hypothetical protein
VTTAAELQRPPHEAQSVTAAPSETLHLGGAAMAADSRDGTTTLQAAAQDSASAAAEQPASAAGVAASVQHQGSTQHDAFLDAALASGPAQSTAERLPESPRDELVSRPVDPAEVAAIRGGVALPAKSPTRAAASLGVGSTVSRMRDDEQGQHADADSADQADPVNGAACLAPADAAHGVPELSAGDHVAETGLAGDTGSAGALGDPSSSPVPASNAGPAHGATFTGAACHCLIYKLRISH